MVERSKCMNAPEIRFRGFDGEWYSIPLSNPDFTIIAGGDIDKNKIKNVGLYPVIANSTTKDGIVGYYDDCFRIEAPSVSVTGRGDVGIAQARKYNYTPVVRLLSIKSFHDVDFLSNAINKRNLIKESTGVPQLTTIQLSKIEINFPYDKNEECKIGLFIDTIDKVINVNSKKLASLKRIKAANLQSMFPQEGETVPKIRFNGFEEEWICILFKEIAYKTGIKNSENLSLESYSISNELGFIPQNEQFENGGTMSKADKRMYYIVSPKSFAYNPARINVGSLGYYQGERDVIVSSLYEVFKTSDIVDDLFLFYWFKTNIFKRMIEQYQEGGVRLYFFFDKLQKCQIKVPSLQEQQKIASYFCNLDKQISLQTQRLEKLKQIKAACLDKMFV